jgi:hypothetical protein
MTNLSPAAQMTNQHPITPPPELVEQWWTEFERTEPDTDSLVFIATQAARWGADQELEACCEWVNDDLAYDVADRLRAARRTKPPSLKEQALAELEILSDYAHGLGCSESAIRRALEALDD